MTGCFVSWKCAVACLLGDESQQPTCPQDMQSRSSCHESPLRRHSLQPCPLGFTGFRCRDSSFFKCAQVSAIASSVQNMVLPLADVGGTLCSTSQCSTIRPCASKRKMSMPAQSLSPGHSCRQCSTTYSPSAMARLNSTRLPGYS